MTVAVGAALTIRSARVMLHAEWAAALGTVAHKERHNKHIKTGEAFFASPASLSKKSSFRWAFSR